MLALLDRMTLKEKLSQLVGYWDKGDGEAVAPLQGEFAEAAGLDLVLVLRLDRVFDDDSPLALVELDQAAVLDRILEARVAVVPALEAVLLGRRQPQAAAGARMLHPHEVAAGYRLVEAVDAQRVVRARAAEVVAPALLRVVRVRARVDEDLAAAD